MTVEELIMELKEFNPKAHVSIGDNFDNELEISWGWFDGCSKKSCEDVNFDIKREDNREYDNGN
jgi:hypothetical protein